MIQCGKQICIQLLCVNHISLLGGVFHIPQLAWLQCFNHRWCNIFLFEIFTYLGCHNDLLNVLGDMLWGCKCLFLHHVLRHWYVLWILTATITTTQASEMKHRKKKWKLATGLGSDKYKIFSSIKIILAAHGKCLKSTHSRGLGSNVWIPFSK